jgi:GxxExxY protein
MMRAADRCWSQNAEALLTTEATEDTENGEATVAINDITGAVVDAAIKVHSTVGPGLLESAYHACLAYELRKRQLKVFTQLELPVTYDGIKIDLGYRIDLLVEGSVVLEIRAVSKLARVHEAQLLSYLKLGGYRAGLLINFHASRLKDGIKRMVN